MIIRTLNDIEGSDRDVRAETWASRRLLLADDNMGFSMHDTIMRAGTETTMWYRNHLEAVYCVAGSGTIEDLATGMVHSIEEGTIYALDQHDRHIVRPTTDIRFICVFNPPCTGDETHDADGAYPLLTSSETNTSEDSS
jgi:L-ectoine synthase